MNVQLQEDGDIAIARKMEGTEYESQSSDSKSEGSIRVSYENQRDVREMAENT